PNESSWQITDDQGNIVAGRNNMTANTLYRDTVELGIGCYQYRVFDTDDDGISFWANSDGNGFTRFNALGGGTVKSFNGDFGDGIIFNFTVDFPLSYEELEALNSVDVHPNPTKDELNVKLEGFGSEVDVQLFNNMGQVVLSRKVSTVGGSYDGVFSLGDLKTGMYVMKVTDGNKSTRVKVIKE
ncbi:hypothetical protein AC249_AIPGENE16624, partial [Exaiptasia diaphana]